jgi:recombination protein RecT
MPVHEIEAHKRRSKASTSGPWVTDYDEMAKKTVFRSLFKWLPISLEEAAAVTNADEHAARYNAGSASPEDALQVDFTVATEDTEEPADAQKVE